MKNNQTFTQSGHPKKQCLYCFLMFYSDHELRKFCPHKFGIHNYCKRKFKDLVEQVRLTGKSIILSSKDSSVNTIIEFTTGEIVVNQATTDLPSGNMNIEATPIQKLPDPELENIKKENDNLKGRLAEEKQLEKNKEVIRKFINKGKVEGAELALENAKFNSWHMLAKLHGFYFKRVLYQTYYQIVHPYPEKYNTFIFK